MAFRNVSHVAIGVRDMARSLPWYRDVLGLDVALDDVEEFGDPGAPAIRRRAVYLRWSDDPDAAFVVLDEQLGSEPVGAPKQLFDIGLHHFGFWVDDVGAVAEQARKADAVVVYGPSDTDTAAYGEPSGGTVRFLLLQDPDGNVVQFEQRVS
jgi:catechol 2,3-dioxygenase-like lactoylglutathione lyase family enzyme